MPWLCTDRNMLFGIVALQRNLISHDALIGAMHEWTRNKTRTIGQILIDRSSLDPETHELLETWVDRELEQLDSERMSEATTSLIAPEKLGDLEPVWRSADGMARADRFFDHASQATNARPECAVSRALAARPGRIGSNPRGRRHRTAP